MKTNVNLKNVFENANNAKSLNSKQMRGGQKEFTSISAVIRAITHKDAWNAGFNTVFGEFGFTDAKQLTPKTVFAKLNKNAVKVTKKDGKKVTEAMIITRKIKKDENGNETGREYTQHVVKSWTPAKLRLVLLQSAQMDATEATPAPTPVKDAPAKGAKGAKNAPAKGAKGAKDAPAKGAKGAKDAPAKGAKGAKNAPAKGAKGAKNAPAKGAKGAKKAPAKKGRK